jgi:hypothetical protein
VKTSQRQINLYESFHGFRVGGVVAFPRPPETPAPTISISKDRASRCHFEPINRANEEVSHHFELESSNENISAVRQNQYLSMFHFS